MAQFFNVAGKDLATTSTTVLTSRSDSTIVLSILAVNTGIATSDITCRHLTSANGIKNVIGSAIVVPTNSNVDLIGNKYILPSGQKLSFLTSVSGTCDVAISYVEV